MAKETELQEIIQRQLREQRQMEERLAALSAHVKHLEEDLDTARKDLLQSKDRNRKLERDVREVSDCSCVCCPDPERAQSIVNSSHKLRVGRSKGIPSPAPWMSLLVKLSVPCGLSKGVDHLLPLWRGITRRMWAGVQSMCAWWG